MRTNVYKKIFFNTFWLSILLHLLLLLLLIYFYFAQKKEESKKSPNLFVPSYVYHARTPTIQQHSSSQSQMKQSKKELVSLKTEEEPSTPNETFSAPTTAESHYVKTVEKRKGHARNKNRPKSMLAATAAYLRQSMHQSISADKDEEPIYLIGENNAVSDPLILLLGKALSAHFAYPRMAGEFGIRGRVIIKLTLHPGGYLTNVQMLQSSNNQDLDAAALYAVNSAPTIYGVDRFITSPKVFVVGFIFR